jgi:hypothetical protein
VVVLGYAIGWDVGTEIEKGAVWVVVREINRQHLYGRTGLGDGCDALRVEERRRTYVL